MAGLGGSGYRRERAQTGQSGEKRIMLGMELSVAAYFYRMSEELDKLDTAAIQRLSDQVYRAWDEGRQVFTLGNGGSAATATHYAADWAKNTISADDLSNWTGKRLKILSLVEHIAWMTALGNDLAYDQIFVQQLAHFGQSGDLVIAISGSGNSPNVLNAVKWAGDHGLTTFGITGYDGGKLKKMTSDGVHVALNDMAMVESIHAAIGHYVVDDLAARIQKIGKYI
ncbi:MAG: SIS domain-containing protein [Planctomycetia bacterium]|nr:SIS domain-containing protein [Planctomycetia bacterium]